jgi:hypothetical protein
MKTIPFTWGLGTVAAIALGAVAGVGCTATTASGPIDPSPAAAQQTQAESSGSAKAHEGHGPTGPDMLLFAAMRHLELTPEQRTTIENAAHTIPPSAPMDGGLFAGIAAGVRAGKLDEAALLAKLDAARPPADRDASLSSAIDTLHATLSAEQRRALVNMIAKHIDEHDQAKSTATASQSPLDHLLSGLNLTGEQRASIDRILGSQGSAAEDPAAMSARIQAFHADLRVRLETFAADRFDAAAFVASSKAVAPMGMREHVQRTIHGLAAVLPVLDASQRESLATTLEAGASHCH